MSRRAEVRELELADLASVRRFCESVDQGDVLVNNAGVFAQPLTRTPMASSPMSAQTISVTSR